jgi:biotin-(acetyl-CoA carboxylase) ligase
MSVVLPDTSSPKKHLLIHIAATLAVANALDEAVRLETNQGEPHPIFRIKLPNDVRVDVGSHFGKICGSLGVGALNEDIKREHALRGWRYPDDYLVMGIGINLSNEVLSRPEGLRFPASSLEFVTGRVFRRELILGLVLRNLDEMLRLTEGNPALLLQKAQAKLALGAGGAAILDTRGGFSDSVVVLELGEDGLRFLHRGELKTVPVEDILRLYPEEPTLPFLR